MKSTHHSQIPTVWAGLGDPRRRGLRVLPKSGGYYVHVTSRAVGQAFLFGHDEKVKFRTLMRQWADFSGIRILTHCLMDNHFHILCWVPPSEDVPHAEIVERLGRVWSEEKVTAWQEYYSDVPSHKQTRMDQAIRDRMGDLPEFMRVLKQSFSRWYNRRQDRRGTLWDSRYRSVVVEENPLALMSVGAYIDLNPIRAGLCEDPKDYMWSGYGSAYTGDPASRTGLNALVSLSRGHLPYAAMRIREKQALRNKTGLPLNKGHSTRPLPKTWEDVQASYRIWLYHKGTSQAENPYAKDKFRLRKGFDPVQVIEEFERQGQLPTPELLTQRKRYFARGLAFGTPDFLESLFATYRECFGPNRKKAARPAKYASWMQVGVMRQVD